MAKAPQLDAQGHRKFGIRDSVAYAAGDLGCNMSFALKGTIMPLFWTQVMGLSAWYSLLIVILQVWDAIKKYNPESIGYAWENSNPRIQLEPIGTRGYIELLAVKSI